MEKSEIKTLLQNVFVEKSCPVSWDSMSGDDKVRLCSQCNLNVHNLSSMSEKEAAIMVKRRQTERTCVFMYRRKDGSVVTDNCPRKLRDLRNKIAGAAAMFLLVLSYGISMTAASAGGKVIGAVVDPAFSQANGGMVPDFGYDDARHVVMLLTAFSYFVVFFIPLNKRRKTSLRRVVLELIALTSVPVLVHLAGMFCVNNFGGLQGGV
jgi:hypothetical protein